MMLMMSHCEMHDDELALWHSSLSLSPFRIPFNFCEVAAVINYVINYIVDGCRLFSCTLAFYKSDVQLLAPPVLKWGHIVYDFWYDPYYSYGTKTNCPRLWTYVCCHLAINEPSFREKIPPTRWRLPVLAGPAILDQVIIFCRIIVDVVNLSNTYIDCNALALL